MTGTIAGAGVGHYPDLAGRAAVVTGATRGLGRSVARVLAAAGARVLVVGRDAGLGEALAAELPGACFLAADLESDDAAATIVGAAADRLGGVDLLVNNAGIYPSLPFGTMTAPELRRIYTVNAITPTLLAQAAAQHMIDSGRAGSIVNVISTSAFRPVPTMLGYSSAKAALAHATRAMAKELALSGVRVNAVAPGAMDHGDGGRAAALGLTEAEYAGFVEKLLSAIPMHRKAADHEVAAAVLFLCSSVSSFMTGAILHCDGGETI